ncbi:MAG: hypothetical protein WC872_01720 [Candidatus Absconditabacterales bacterium]
MKLYHIASIAKAILGLIIIIIDYTLINVYEDPVIGIGLGLLGTFIFAWGISFYLFIGIQKIFRNTDNERIVKDSYKLSLLFGIYIMINVLLLLLGYRGKLIGILLLIGFAILQISLFADNSQKDERHF